MGVFRNVVGAITNFLGVETGYQNNYAGDGGYDASYYEDDAYAQEDYGNEPYDDPQRGYASDYDDVPPEQETYNNTYRRPAGAAQTRAGAQEDDGNVFGNHRSVPRDNVVQMNAGERKAQQVARVENLLPEVSNEKQMNAECEKLINQLLKGEILVISTVNVDEKQRNRMVLMLSGAAFAVKATFIRINASTYMMAPEGVKVVEADERPRAQAPLFGQNDFYASFQ